MVDHLAVHFDDAARKLRVINKLDELIKPHVADKGYDCEFHIDETPRELWQINGFIPRRVSHVLLVDARCFDCGDSGLTVVIDKSEAEAMWAKNNGASEWQGNL